MEAGVLDELPPGAPEQRVVHEVEPYERREEADVCQREAIAGAEVPGPGEVFLERVQRGEELAGRSVVGLLALREPAAVHAVVDARVDDAVPAVDLPAELRRVQVEVSVVSGEGAEELGDLDALVAEDLAAVGVPEHGHGRPALELPGPRAIDVAEPALAVEPVGAGGRE